MNLRPAQQQAVEARGNVVVMAGAGTGKTRTLVERCLHCLGAGKPRIGIDQMLLVTFTEAAAAEMRQRIRSAIEEKVSASPEDEHWQNQVALFENAHIGTLHGFCYKLVREHFYSLGLDPQLAIMPEAESKLMAQEVLTELLSQHYSGNSLLDQQVRDLAELQGGARGEDVLRSAVMRIHEYSRSLADPLCWLKGQLQVFSLEAHPRWQDWYELAVRQWCAESLPFLRYLDQRDGNEMAKGCESILAAAPAQMGRAWIADCFARVQARLDDCPHGRKVAWLGPLKAFAADADFLASLLPGPDSDPLQQDWLWVREPAATCIQLALEFSQSFASAKRQAGLLDFHDLEQFALDLLWNRSDNKPTELAGDWRQRLSFVFVDEYQDINEAQDKILAALSREGGQANRFLVGDFKQSIYRFRLASPRIFQEYVKTWRGEAGSVIALQENFRSRENILQFVNSLFGALMGPGMGGVAYDSEARLHFGSAPGREPLACVSGADPRVEIRLRIKGSGASQAAEDLDLQDLDEPSKDARAVALRLWQLHQQGHLIWDEAQKEERPVRWGDMAVLLRARKSKTAVYAREFSRLGVPLHVDRGGFYDNSEIQDLLSLLQLLDNPFQDIPVLAVLRSPLVGLSANELAAIRVGRTRCCFWAALRQWSVLKSDPADVWTTQETRTRVARFLNRYAEWRTHVRRASLSSFLSSVLTETGYDTWLLTQDQGTQRYANVQILIGMAKEFDGFQRQGLVRFLNFVDAQRDLESEPDVPANVSENAVRLLTVHQSKGLEFPVVVLAGITTSFNLRDLSEDLLFDEEYGICTSVRPPGAGSRYPSLPLWLARRRQSRELRGEELRLFYVALTRARDTLILSGSLSEKQLAAWQEAALDSSIMERAKSAAEWLGNWFVRNVKVDCVSQPAGSNELVSWRILNELDLLEGIPETAPGSADTLQPGKVDWDSLDRVLGWRYPLSKACLQPAKTTVSAIRRAAAALDGESDVCLPGAVTHRKSPGPGSTAAEVGTLHHLFLQHVDLGLCGSVEDLRQEADRMMQLGLLTAAQAADLDLNAILRFWNSDLGRQIRSSSATVRRELPFTFRLAASEIACLLGSPGSGPGSEEFIIIQGIVDLLFKGPDGLVIVDFKTDSVDVDELVDRAEAYRSQVAVYARAIEAIYNESVADCWLYFLRPGKALQMKPSGSLSR